MRFFSCAKNQARSGFRDDGFPKEAGRRHEGRGKLQFVMGVTQGNIFPGWMPFVGLFLVTMAGAMFFIPHMISKLEEAGITAPETERGIHKGTIPVGGGLVIVMLVLLLWPMFFVPPAFNLPWAVFAGFASLAGLSWLDDKGVVAIVPRLLMQAGAIGLVLLLLPEGRAVFSGSWPLWADRMLTGVFWMWFINLYNFMDGMDGLAGTETLFICAGLFLVGLPAGLDQHWLYLTVTLAGATFGFLWWNWPPARIFLGDVGSIPMGFILGFLLIQLALHGHLAAAFLLPACFLADASVTLFLRLWNKEPIWRAHRKHFYQRAALALGDHRAVLIRIIMANAALLPLAWLSLIDSKTALSGGAVVVVLLLLFLKRQGGD